MAEPTRENPHGYDCRPCGRKREYAVQWCSRPADSCPAKCTQETVEELLARYAPLNIWTVQ